MKKLILLLVLVCMHGVSASADTRKPVMTLAPEIVKPTDCKPALDTEIVMAGYKFTCSADGYWVYYSPITTQPSTRWGITATIGTQSGLGYKLPYTAFGGAIERTLGNHVELQVSGDYSPSHKYITSDGHQFHAYAAALYWFRDNAALYANDGEGFLYTSQFQKQANFPQVGVATRLFWMGVPSRIYFTYIVPTGKRPTDGSLQSNRTQGMGFVYEGQGWDRVRIITTFHVLTFLDQSGAAPGLRHWTGTIVMTVRFGTKMNSNQLY